MRIQIISIFLLACLSISAQEVTENTLGFAEFISLVKNEHPMARQADIKAELGQLEILKARGNFDPKVEVDLTQKYFDGKEYYDLGNGKLKLPTWFGLELEGGLERNEGVFLNPENYTPNAGLWFAGISIPLGEGLFIDERRATLRKAQAIAQLTEAEKNKLLNDLLLDAGEAYWSWYAAYYQLQINQEALRLANERFTAVKLGASLGDLPAIDTLESGIQVQNRQLNLNQSILNFKNATAYLSTFLWQNLFIPLELAANIIPKDYQPALFDRNPVNNYIEMDSVLNNHPEILMNNAYKTQLTIEQRWVREQLKPSLNIKYKPLLEAVGENPFDQYSITNYTWGLQFEMPLFLRKERAKVNQLKLKLENIDLNLELKKVNLRNKAIQAKNDYETTIEQINIYQKTVSDYEALLAGEQRLFDGGESSLFLINSRELGFISAELKMIELIAKNRISFLKLNHALGTLATI